MPLFTSDDYSVTHKPSLRGLYGDAVSEMDSSIGRLLRALEEEDISSNTLVIFLSDNGAWVQPNAGLTPRPTKGISPFDGGSNATIGLLGFRFNSCQNTRIRFKHWSTTTSDKWKVER